MKIFLVLSNAPDPRGEAIEVVTYEVIEHARRLGHSLVVQVILREPQHGSQAAQTRRLLEQLNLPNVETCPTLYLDDVADRKRLPGLLGRLARLATSFQTGRLFPASRLGPVVESRAVASGAAAIVSIWSWEALAATYRIRGIPKFVYYGNPDHLPPAARFKNPELFDIPTSSLPDRLMLFLERAWNRRRKALNIMMMNACEVAANNSALDTKFYSANGHRRSIYLQNMWPDIHPAAARRTPETGGARVVKIVGSVGNLGATGNTFALAYLGKELMPRLAQRFGDRRFEVHLFGRGKPSAYVARHLNDPNLVRRGWVEDINDDIRSADAFLVLTNVNDDFLVGNTRILLAWALRGCVIMHANSGLAMPEIAHGENVLSGRSPDEIADWIVRAADDQELRATIAEGGFQTFQTYYRSDVVVPRMLSLVEDMVHDFEEDNRKYHRRGVGNRHAAIDFSGVRQEPQRSKPATLARSAWPPVESRPEP